MMILGIEDPWIWSIFILIIVFTLVCIVYGVLKWNE